MDCRIFAGPGPAAGLRHHTGCPPAMLEEFVRDNMFGPFLTRLRSHILDRDNTRDLTLAFFSG